MVRAQIDYLVDRAQLQAGRPAQASATNSPSSSSLPLTTYGDHRWTCRAHATARVARGIPGPPAGSISLPRERLPRAEPWSGGSPDSIPNSAVKPHLAESTAAPGRGRTGRSARRGRFSALTSYEIASTEEACFRDAHAGVFLFLCALNREMGTASFFENIRTRIMFSGKLASMTEP